MGFLDKVKDVGNKAMKTVLLSAYDWSGKVLSGQYNDIDLKDCLVATDSQGKAVVFYKGLEEACRIPTSELGSYMVEPDIEDVSTITAINFKNDIKQIITIWTKFNTGSSSASGTKIPGVYFDTRGDSYIKFIDFLKENTKGPSDEATPRKIEIVVDLVKKLNNSNRG